MVQNSMESVLYLYLCSVNTSTQSCTVHIFLVSVLVSGSVNTDERRPCYNTQIMEMNRSITIQLRLASMSIEKIETFSAC